MSRILALVILALSVLVSGCILPEATENEMEFAFPDPARDTEDEAGVWHGTRNYTGDRGAKIAYVQGACAGLIKAKQDGDYYPGTRIEVPGTGHLKLSVQGPCVGAYQVKVIP